MTAVGAIRRGSAHPPLGARTPARTEDFFDDAQLADLRAYARPRKRVDLAAKVVTGAVDLLLIFGLDLGPRIDDAVGGSPWPVRLVVVAAAFALVSQVLLLPADWWSTMVHDRRHGLSNQSTGLWVSDQVKGMVLTVVLTALLLVPVYWAVRELDTWWLAGGLAFLVVALFLNFVYPVLIMPRFNRFTPMEPGPLRTRIEEIADLADTRIEGVYTMDGSTRSRRGNAFVAGFGPTKRVVVFDTMLDFPLEQIATVVAHEIGHYRLDHIPKTFPLAGLQVLVALAFVQHVVGSGAVLGWAGVDDLGEPGAAPLFLLGLGVPMAALGLVSAWWSRRNEREADLEALELLGDPTSFVGMWPALVERNKADLEPSWWERLNASHPGPAERMQFGLDWAAMNDVPVDPPPRSGVPRTTAGGQPGTPERDAP